MLSSSISSMAATGPTLAVGLKSGWHLLQIGRNRHRLQSSELPDRDKEVVKELLDAFLTKRQIQQLAAR